MCFVCVPLFKSYSLDHRNLWVPRILSIRATCTYSCRRRPIRFRRSGRMVAPVGGEVRPTSTGGVLTERSVRAVDVVMLDVLLQQYCEVACSTGQKVVEAFTAQGTIHRSAMAFALGDRTGVRMMRMSASANTASKTAVNLTSTTPEDRRGRR
jgi:hypothetical protein